MAAIAFRYIIPMRPLAITSSGDSNHKLAYNDEDIIRIMYRVNTWKVLATGTVIVISTGETTTCTWMNVGLPSTYTTELDLQRGPQKFANTALLPTSTTGPGTGSINVSVFTDPIGSPPTATQAVQYDSAGGPNFWWPFFVLTMTVRNSTGLLFGQVRTGDSTGSAGAATFDGRSWPSNVTVNSASVSFTGSAAVSPETFWPYDPGDGGGPIYNTTTGDAIRNPFAP
jgi:hypothetical protein